MIDFHCHLELYPDPTQEASRCTAKKLDILSVGTTPSAFAGTKRIAKGHPRIRTALGFHPHLATQRISELGVFDNLVAQVKYVGEVGLDGAPEFEKSVGMQIRVFTHILNQCSKHGGRILSIHSRRAAGEVLDLLEKHRGCGSPILHWFSGTKNELRKAISLGAWFSVGPAMLRGQRGRDLVEAMPPSKILTETDGPFASVKRCQLRPGEVGTAYCALSKIWNCDLVQVEGQMRSNLATLEGPRNSDGHQDDSAGLSERARFI